MIRSILIGAVAGMRSMLPLAMLSVAEGPRKGVTPSLLALAVGEIAGDKWAGAPDRISAAGLAARVTTGALAAAAVAPPHRRYAGAVVGSAAAVAGGCLSFALRVGAMRRFGRVKTGLTEDVIALAATLWILRDPEVPAARERRLVGGRKGGTPS